MAIVEASSCGLQVVSTKVGGIPEVLPSSLIILTEANVDALLQGILKAIENVIRQRKKTIKNGMSNMSSQANQLNSNVYCAYECNDIVRNLYTWNDITVRTEKVYRRVINEKEAKFGEKLNCYLNACIPFVLVVSFSYLFLKFMEFFEPRQYIDVTNSQRKIVDDNRSKKK